MKETNFNWNFLALVHIETVRELNSVEAAFIFADLHLVISNCEESEKVVKKDNRVYFPYLTKEMEERTTLSYKVQTRCINLLKEKGFIDVELIGLPAKRHFCLLRNLRM